MRIVRRCGRLPMLALAPMLAFAVLFGFVVPATPSVAQGGAVTLEWFGWSHFRLTSVNGKVILINPYIEGNPDAAISVDDITTADLILPADGHGDELGSTVQLALKTGARVLGPGELRNWIAEQGVPREQLPGGNPGSRMLLEGVTVRVVHAIHSTGLPKPTMTAPYGGIATGFVTTFENGWTVYFTGSSAATQDQALWGELYKPDAVIFHMSGDKEPLDAAATIRYTMTNNPNLKTLIPHHHRVNPPAGATTIADVQGALATMGITTPIMEPVRSQVYTFTR
jgi:L-ascorbate metabolism protein UlaG (beta-lactamase superfamily)